MTHKECKQQQPQRGALLAILTVMLLLLANVVGRKTE
nr:MAG TPA: hypothetical protein [Caudoviricetes sp.]DAV40418.1 MAG TPA: hypothetical protein [Caudoviricetes sp.]